MDRAEHSLLPQQNTVCDSDPHHRRSRLCGIQVAQISELGLGIPKQLEPGVGIEPTTYALRVRCSTTELSRPRPTSGVFDCTMRHRNSIKKPHHRKTRRVLWLLRSWRTLAVEKLQLVNTEPYRS